jgi:hypothetical protein
MESNVIQLAPLFTVMRFYDDVYLDLIGIWLINYQECRFIITWFKVMKGKLVGKNYCTWILGCCGYIELVRSSKVISPNITGGHHVQCPDPCRGATRAHVSNAGHDLITKTGWWFQTWLLFSISYTGCHPSHWRTHIFQDGYCTTNQKMYVSWADVSVLPSNISPRRSIIGNQ